MYIYTTTATTTTSTNITKDDDDEDIDAYDDGNGTDGCCCTYNLIWQIFNMLYFFKKFTTLYTPYFIHTVSMALPLVIWHVKTISFTFYLVVFTCTAADNTHWI